MIMHLDYAFEFDGKRYEAVGIDVGDTDDIEREKKDIKSNKIAAICHEFDLTIDEYEEQAEKFKNVKFDYIELY